MIRVLLVEDDPDWARMLSWMLKRESDLTWEGHCSTVDEAYARMMEIEIDVLLLDMMLDDQPHGISIVEKFMRNQPHVKVIMLTNMQSSSFVMKSFQRGAVNYILKSAAQNDLVDAIRAAFMGSSAIHPDAAELMRQSLVEQEENRWANLLSVREKEILLAISEGLTSRQIALRFCIEEHSVDNYVTRLNRKLEAKNRFEAVQLAKERGIIEY